MKYKFLTEEHKQQIRDLVMDTIQPALSEDLMFEETDDDDDSEKQYKEATRYLIEQLIRVANNITDDQVGTITIISSFTS